MQIKINYSKIEVKAILNRTFNNANISFYLKDNNFEIKQFSYILKGTINEEDGFSIVNYTVKRNKFIKMGPPIFIIFLIGISLVLGVSILYDLVSDLINGASFYEILQQYILGYGVGHGDTGPLLIWIIFTGIIYSLSKAILPVIFEKNEGECYLEKLLKDALK